MRKGLNRKYYFVFLVPLIIFVLGWMSIGSQNSFNRQLKALVPPAIKPFLRQNLFWIPDAHAKNKVLAIQLEEVVLAYRIENKNLKTSIKKLKAQLKFLNRKYRLMDGMLKNEFNVKYGLWERYGDNQRQIIPCPKSANVILVAGQSNSANALLSFEYENKLHVNYFNGSCYVLDNPVLGATSMLSSVAPAIASKLTSKSPYIFLTSGWGGTSIRSWSMDNSELSGYTNNELRDLEKKGHNLSAVVWIQGETDSINFTRREIDYKSHFNIMKSKFLRGLSNKQNVKFVITQSSRCANQPRDGQ